MFVIDSDIDVLLNMTDRIGRRCSQVSWVGGLRLSCLGYSPFSFFITDTLLIILYFLCKRP